MGLLTIDGKPVTVGGKLIKTNAAPSTPYVVAEYTYVEGEGHLMKNVKLYNHTAFMANEFYGQYKLSEIDCSDPSNNIKSVESYAFYVSNVSSLTIPSTVKNLMEGCFNAAILSTITIPDGVTEIPRSAFQSVSGPYDAEAGERGSCTINLPDGLLSIGEMAFDSSLISTITIPGTVTSIGYRAFSYCNKLPDITIPSSVTTIGGYAFAWMDAIEELTIPANVTLLGDGGCVNCEKLSTLNVLANVTEIPDSFADSSPLTSLTLPDTITTIGMAAFLQHHLSEVTIPAAVTSIGARAFWKADTTNASDAWTVTCLPTTPPTISNDIFGNATDNITIKVPAASVAAYKAATNWATLADHIVAIS